MSKFLRPHGPQHARPPCPLLSPGVCSHSLGDSRIPSLTQWTWVWANFSNGSGGKESAWNAGDSRDIGLIPVWEDPWRRKSQPTPVLLPEKSHRQRSLAGYSPCGCKELDRTQWLTHWEIMKDREARHAVVQGVTKCWTRLSDWTTTMSIELVMPSKYLIICRLFFTYCHLSKHQSLFQWVSSSHQVAKVLEFQL